eukprot:1985803-Prymnesium_polylepis.1
MGACDGLGANRLARARGASRRRPGGCPSATPGTPCPCPCSSARRGGTPAAFGKQGRSGGRCSRQTLGAKGLFTARGRIVHS